MYYFRRFLAAQIDFIISAPLYLPIIYSWFYFSDRIFLTPLIKQIFISTSLLIPLSLYFIILEILYGRTVGKKILKLRVISIKGEKIKKKQIVIRNISRLFDHGLFFGIFLIFFSKKNQRIGDYVTNTVVVDDRETLPSDGNLIR